MRQDLNITREKYLTICGIDEAGRGALAGPLVAASVILPPASLTILKNPKIKIRDGKLLSSKQRTTVYSYLKKMRVKIAVEFISVRQINNHGIGWANKEIIRRLVRNGKADLYLIDGNLQIGKMKSLSAIVQSVIDGDAFLLPVVLAGIIAKVERDRIMRSAHDKFPMYYWRKNMGYGTKKHVEAINVHGMSLYHRPVFVATAIASLTKKECE